MDLKWGLKLTRSVMTVGSVGSVSAVGASSRNVGDLFWDFFTSLREKGVEPNSTGGQTLATGTTTAGFALAQSLFRSSPKHIPDIEALGYKTEWVLLREIKQTLKVNWWHGPDDKREPHNHPWLVFDSYILSGGYKERRYWIDENGELQTEEFSYKQGDINHFPQNQYHLVTEILPETMTLMRCGESTEGNAWGYLDVHTKAQTRAAPDPSFMARLKAANPLVTKKT